MTRKSLTYRDAGVDIDEGDRLVERIKPIAKKTMRPEVLAGIGGFGALFEIPVHRYKKPILVSGTDGVGTKLKLAQQMDKHDTIGIDLVAMCVNDIVVSGAEPLYFLDYFATGKLDVNIAEHVIKGIGAGCELAGAALTGGETAEMPGMYSPGEYDLAGFAVGIVEKDQIIDGSTIVPGDVLLGLGSSGPHSNGYSLIRRVVAHVDADLDEPFGNSTLGETLLEPTRIYVKSLLSLMQKMPVKGLAHITGGGIVENLPRVMPENTQARVDINSWPMPPIFDWLRTQGNIEQSEMLRTFNCGIGMVVCVSEENADAAFHHLRAAGEQVYRIGTIETSSSAEPCVVF